MGRRSFVLGAALGAGLMYLVDPELGPARRRRLGDRARTLLTEIEGELGEVEAEAPSAALAAPMPAEPSPNGTREHRAGDIPGLELPEQRRARRRAGALARLTERAGILGVAGGALAAYGLVRRGRTGRMLRVAGVGLLARGLREAERAAAPRAERRRALDVQQSLEVAAPPARVFEFWARGDNFARFLGHVREARDLGGGRTRWRAESPEGTLVEWTTEIVEYVPHRRLAWRSVAGAPVRQSGVVRLTPAPAGTRIDLRLCYGPPEGEGEGGSGGELFGNDPRRQIDEDLERLRALLEAAAPAARQGDVA